MQTIRYLSLFSGIGGFELGIEKAFGNTGNYRQSGTIQKGVSQSRTVTLPDHHAGKRFSTACVGYSEINKSARSIYKRHFPGHHHFGDITSIDEKALPDFDLLCGGFPCQSFSISGLQKGFNDERGLLFFEMARIIREKQPRLLLLENVKGLLSVDEGRAFGTILSTLDELGYDIQWQVLNSKNFGVPQNRERVFIVAHLRGTARPKVFPLTQRQGDPVSNETGIVEAIAFDPIANNAIRHITPIECERLQGFPDHWTQGLSDRQRYRCIGNAVTVPVIETIVSHLSP